MKMRVTTLIAALFALVFRALIPAVETTVGPLPQDATATPEA